MERSQAKDVSGCQVSSQADQSLDNLEVIPLNLSKHLPTLPTLGLTLTAQPVSSHNHLEDAGDIQEGFSPPYFPPDFWVRHLLESLEISAVVDFEPSAEMLIVTDLQVQASPPIEEENSTQVLRQLQWSLRSISPGEDRLLLPANDSCNLLRRKLFSPPTVFSYNGMNYLHY